MVDIRELAEGLYIESYVEDEKKEIETRLKNESLLKAYKKMLAYPEGKRVLWDLLSYCEAFQNAMTGNSWTYHKLGKQSVGQYIIMMLNLGNKFDDVLGFQKIMPEDNNG